MNRACHGPRALHLNLGELDSDSPIDEARAGIEHIARIYADHGCADRFSTYIEFGAGHVMSPEMWTRTREVFARYLKQNSDSA